MIYIIYAFLAATLAAVFYRFYTPKEDPEMPSTDHSVLEVAVNTTPIPTTPPAVAPTSPVAAPLVPKVSMAVFCGHIRDYEGKPGALNYQLNNPGDCRPSDVGYLPKYEPVVIVDTDTDPRYPYHKGKFAKFPTYELGWEYLQALIHGWATLHPNWTLYQLFSAYAPSNDKNDPNLYAETIAKQCGVIPSTTLKTLFSGVA